MPSAKMLGDQEISDLARAGYDANDPSDHIAELVAALDEDRIPDPADVLVAIGVAGSLAEKRGDLDTALTLFGRLVDAEREQGDPDLNNAIADRARLLLVAGRDEEGLTELSSLRDLLLTDADAPEYLTEALVRGGRPEIAEQWLSIALREAMERAREAMPGGPATGEEDELADEATFQLYLLARERHAVRHQLELPHDELDHLAERLESALGEEEGGDGGPAGPTAVLFFREPEFDRLSLRAPTVAERLDGSWDAYRAGLEKALVALSAAGGTLRLYPGTADGLVAFAGDGDPADPVVLDEYADQLSTSDEVDEVAWPPGRNEPCWCGSGQKYKKCCLPRSRA